MTQVKPRGLAHGPAVVVFGRVLDVKLSKESDRLGASGSVARSLNRLHPNHGSDRDSAAPLPLEPLPGRLEATKQVDQDGGVENRVAHQE